MDNEKFVKWCETATVDIRYPPDRKMVANELVGHLEDGRDGRSFSLRVYLTGGGRG